MNKDKYFNELISILSIEYASWDMPIISKLKKSMVDPYRILITTVLSLRTKDTETEKADKRLFSVVQTPEEMLKLSKERIAELIYPVGFYKRKSIQILEISKILITKYNSKVPANKEELLSLPGVGLKTANLVLALGFNIPAICVDTHVHRISNRLGIVKTKTPEKTELILTTILPKKYWIIYNDLLVPFGQNICRPTSPRCSECKIIHLCAQKDVIKKR